MLKKGEKIHVVTRRSFNEDLRRHFVGEILDVEGTLARVQGYVFVYDQIACDYLRKDNRRVKILSLSDAANIINVIPAEINIDELDYVFLDDKKLVCTDNKSFSLDINEFGARR